MIPKPPYPLNTMGSCIRYERDGTSSVAAPGDSLVWSGSRSSVSTPGFPKVRVLPDHPFSHIYNFVKTEYAEYGGKDPTALYWAGWKGRLSSIPFTWVEVDPGGRWPVEESRRLALNRLYEQLNSREFGDSVVNLGQAYAERQQTVNMIIKSAARIASAAKAIRYGKFLNAQKIFGVLPPHGQRLWTHDLKPSPKNLSNHWLEFQYGWRPLLSDIYGASQQLAKSYDPSLPKMTTVTGKSRVSVSNRSLRRYFTSVKARHEEWQTETYVVKTSYKIDFCEDNALLARLSQTGITNPLNLAWELLPFSFVIDWFAPVGNYLQSLSATHGLEYRGGTKSQIWEGIRFREVLTKPTDSSNYHFWYGGKITEEHKRFTRDVLDTWPENALPWFNGKPLSVQHGLNAIALLVQLFPKR